MHLISEKIEVPEAVGIVPRPRLLDTLADSIERCSSTLVTGRAGTGKTTLAADFAQRCGWDVAWYEVDASDADPAVFMSYLAATVDRHRPGFGSSVGSLTLVGAGDDMQTIANLFVYSLLEHEGDPLLLVLDDLHLVYDAPWFTPLLGRLLVLLPLDVHLMVIGRGVPPGPIWRMRSKQTLCLVDEAELAFTTAEARHLFESVGAPVRLAEAAIEVTRGRAVALVAEARAAAEEQRHEARRPRPDR